MVDTDVKYSFNFAATVRESLKLSPSISVSSGMLFSEDFDPLLTARK